MVIDLRCRRAFARGSSAAAINPSAAHLPHQQELLPVQLLHGQLEVPHSPVDCRHARGSPIGHTAPTDPSQWVCFHGGDVKKGGVGTHTNLGGGDGHRFFEGSLGPGATRPRGRGGRSPPSATNLTKQNRAPITEHTSAVASFVDLLDVPPAKSPASKRTVDSPRVTASRATPAPARYKAGFFV